MSLAVLMAGPNPVDRHGDGLLVEQVLRAYLFDPYIWRTEDDRTFITATLDDKWLSRTDDALRLLVQAGVEMSGEFRGPDGPWCVATVDGALHMQDVHTVPADDLTRLQAQAQAWERLHAAAIDGSLSDAEVRALAAAPLS